MLALKVPKPKAEEARLILTDMNILDKDHRIIVGEEFVEIPLLREPADSELETLSSYGEIVLLSEKIPRERFYQPMKEIINSLRLPEEMLAALPKKWELFGDVLIFKLDEELESEKGRIAEVYAQELGAKTVLRDAGGIRGEFREPVHEILYGEDTIATHLENGIYYSFDAARLMFSSGNVDERIRMAGVCEPGEVVADMFAGIGYFSLPVAVYSEPKQILAYELNPLAFEYLVRNLGLNDVESIVRPHLSNCRDAVEGVADRVIMGYVGTTHEYLPKAMRILKPGGGIVHYHETCPNELLPQRPTNRVMEAAVSEGKTAEVLNIKNIKSYAPGISHVVLDTYIE